MNIIHYMLAHPVFSYQYNSLIQMSIGWKIYTTLYINFPLVNHRLKTKKDKGDIENNNVSTFFTNVLVLETKKEKIADIICYLFRYSGLLLLNIIIYEWRVNSRHSMLAHPVCSQHYNSLIQISSRWKKYQTIYDIFPLGNHWLKIEKFTRDIADNYVSTSVILQFFWLMKKRSKYISDILC